MRNDRWGETRLLEGDEADLTLNCIVQRLNDCAFDACHSLNITQAAFMVTSMRLLLARMAHADPAATADLMRLLATFTDPRSAAGIRDAVDHDIQKAVARVYDSLDLALSATHGRA